MDMQVIALLKEGAFGHFRKTHFAIFPLFFIIVILIYYD